MVTGVLTKVLWVVTGIVRSSTCYSGLLYGDREGQENCRRIDAGPIGLHIQYNIAYIIPYAWHLVKEILRGVINSAKVNHLNPKGEPFTADKRGPVVQVPCRVLVSRVSSCASMCEVGHDRDWCPVGSRCPPRTGIVAPVRLLWNVCVCSFTCTTVVV